MNDRENYLRALEFRGPEWIPCRVVMHPTLWKQHREKLEGIVLDHPRIFPEHEKGSVDYDNIPDRWRVGQLTDSWGCVWENLDEGVIGQVVGHPLADWKAFDDYVPPDPLTTADFGERDWPAAERFIRKRKDMGLLTQGHGERLFDLMYALRGFENLMIDIATDAPQLPRLVDMILDYEMKLVGKWLEIGVDEIYFHTDIGTQDALMISPAKFRKYIKPMFKTLFQTCRRAGTHVRLSSDGCLLEIVDDLVECGVSVHDPQFRANTLEGIASHYKGKMCLDLDLDRQLFPFCTPAEIRRHVAESVEALYMPEGGLMLTASLSDDVPLANIEAMANAFEEFCFES